MTIDGYDLNELSIESIRKNITYISQDSYIFKDTVRKNIVLERNDISDEQILDVMEQIGANPLLNRLDNGLDEIVDVNRLSKGELQVIAFIRAIVHKANIYIFDEPTAALDPLMEIEVFNKIINKINDKISFFITHRLGFTDKVDKILMIKNNCLCEIGTFAELVNMKGEFYRLYESQKKLYLRSSNDD